MSARANALRRAAAGVVAAAFLALAPAASAGEPERALKGVLEAIDANRLDLAMRRVEALIAEHPNFRLAYLIRGDLLLARARPLQTFGDVPKTVPRDKVEGLREEALLRLRALRDRPDGRVPSYVLQLGPEQKHVLVVDSHRSRLFEFENVDGRPRYVADYYVTLGKNGVEKTREGDQKTPIGVYTVIASLPRQKLTDFYGAGAYPINYPNAWDRSLGRNGHGIWLHGTPSNMYSRPPRASDGCIVLANTDLEAVAHTLQIGLTPVIIADDIEWTSAAAVEAKRESLAAAIESWRADWESRDTAKYLSHYDRAFRSDDENLAAWSEHKRRVNSGKSWIKVKISRLSMFQYPRERFIEVSFEQDYRSSNLSNVMRKRQYWVKEGPKWRILYEGAG
ncbi:MAG TPA: L,D-transpeptidase family protein [Burkholderiales bacterium]|nr:L,D-transpeptidase family protein [Burkholderiales bacterium]